MIKHLDTLADAIKGFGENPDDESAKSALALLVEAVDDLSSKSGDYPDTPITADVFMESIDVANLAHALTLSLRENNMWPHEEVAARLWCSAVLATRSHYHHVVGPPMLARAECNERLGNTELAHKIYDAIALDFLWFIDHLKDETGKTPPDDYHAVVCLDQALEGRDRTGDSDSSTEREMIATIVARGTE